MAGIDWPSTGLAAPDEVTVSAIEHVIGEPNPYHYARQVYNRAHQWHLTLHWNYMDGQEYMRLFGHLNRCRGGVDLFIVPFFSYTDITTGTKTGTVTLSGAHSAGTIGLSVTGGSGLFGIGDWIWINEGSNLPRAYVCVRDEAPAGSISVNPPLRAAAASGSTVHHAGPSGGAYTSNMRIVDLMELADPQGATSMPSPDPGFYQPFAVEFVSALRRVP